MSFWVYSREPDLVVGKDPLVRIAVEVVHPADVANIGIEAALYKRLLLGREISALLGPIYNEESRDDGDDGRHGTLDDEDPPPSGKPIAPAQSCNGVGQETAERATDQGGAEEDARPFLVLVPLVVHRCQVDHARQDTSFEEAEEESERDEGLVALDEPHTHIDDAPAEHQAAEVVGRSKFADEHVTGHLEEDIGNKVDLAQLVSGSYRTTREEPSPNLLTKRAMLKRFPVRFSSCVSPWILALLMFIRSRNDIMKTTNKTG